MKPATEGGSASIDWRLSGDARGLRRALRRAKGLGANLLRKPLHHRELPLQVLRREVEDEVGHSEHLVRADVLQHFGGGAAERQAVAARGLDSLGNKIHRYPKTQRDVLGI